MIAINSFLLGCCCGNQSNTSTNAVAYQPIALAHDSEEQPVI